MGNQTRKLFLRRPAPASLWLLMGTLLHSWESSWVGATEAGTLVARLSDNGKAPRPRPHPALRSVLSLSTHPTRVYLGRQMNPHQVTKS